jgi:hypothetical protein
MAAEPDPREQQDRDEHDDRSRTTHGAAAHGTAGN